MTCLRLLDYWPWFDIIEDIFYKTWLCGFWSLPCQLLHHIIHLLASGCSGFGLVFCFHAASVFCFFFFLDISNKAVPVLSASIKLCSNTDMDSEGLRLSAGPTCMRLGLCHASLPTWCLQETEKRKRTHCRSAYQGLTPLLGISEAWKDVLSVYLEVSSWALVDESVEGLAGVQEAVLAALKPHKETNWSPPTTTGGSGQQFSWRRCPDQAWLWANILHSHRDVLCAAAWNTDLSTPSLMGLYFDSMLF